MDLLQKAKLLGEAGAFDSCGPKACEIKVKNSLGGLYHAKSELKNCRMLKTLMDNSCSYDCKYCPNSASCKTKRVSYTPEELNKVFQAVRQQHDVNGLFLSSGVAGDPDKTTERMLEAVKLVRQTFKGYLHFKVLPGTSYHLIKEASQYANRMSINIEAPSKSVLSELSTVKDYKTDILKRQAWVSRMGVSQTTQMIINNLATDKDVLRMVDWEYSQLKLDRVYYSGFRPVHGTPLENEAPCSINRQNHLYNVDFMIRKYNIASKEFDAILDDGMLPDEDPKMALAKATLDGPSDINECTNEEVIRIAGIGPDTARKIIETKDRITSFSQLNRFGAWIERAKPFISIEGKRQASLMEFC